MIRIILADDHQMFLDGMKALMRNEKDIKVIGEALNGREVLDLVKISPPDIVLMDLNMPELDGMETTRILRRDFPVVKVIMLTMNAEKDMIVSMVEAGASGYLLKNSGRKELTDALKAVAGGKLFFGRDVSDIVIKNAKKPETDKTTQDISVLTEREKEVLKHIAMELTTQEIADKLFISVNTVETHRKNLLAKLNVRNMVGLVKIAVKMKLIE